MECLVNLCLDQHHKQHGLRHDFIAELMQPVVTAVLFVFILQDTEDLVNLKLDQHRNQLIGIDLIMTGFTCSLAIMTATAGYFGMNLNSYIQVQHVTGICYMGVYVCVLSCEKSA
jgi:Mg2+ and Co2+ transporter CorA